MLHNSSQKGFILNIVLIGIVLGMVFLSQQPDFRFFDKEKTTSTSAQTGFMGSLWQKTSIWLENNLPAGVSRGVEQGTEKIIEEKNNFMQNVWGNIKNYFAKKFSKISGTKVE